MSGDIDLVADVSDELFWDPKVDSAAIAVSASDGTVTLRGTVGSLREKREAREGCTAGVRRGLGRQPAAGEADGRPADARTPSFAATCCRR